jgi:hypothetical protein
MRAPGGAPGGLVTVPVPFRNADGPDGRPEQGGRPGRHAPGRHASRGVTARTKTIPS